MGDRDEQQWINHDPGVELQTLAQARQQREALQLRIGGANYIEIGDHYGITARAAQRIVEQAIKDEVPTELRDEMRAIVLTRLDVITKRCMLRLASASCAPEEQERAEERLLKVIDRVVDITGIREPVKVDVTNRDALDAEIDALVQDLTRPVPAAPDVRPPTRHDNDRIDPDLSRGSGRWQARMHRTDRDTDRDHGDHSYGDPNVP